MLHDRRPPAIVPMLETMFVGGCAACAALIHGIATGSPVAGEMAAAVGFGALSLGAMVFGVAWNGLTVTVIDSRPLPPPIWKPEPVSVPDNGMTYLQDAPAMFRPDIAFLPMGNGYTATLHITAEQLTELRRRVISNELRLPINGMKKFSSSQARALRTEAEGLQLARPVNGNQLEWTPEAAGAILRASPAPLMRV